MKKPEPVPEVTRGIDIAKLDGRAQDRARMLRKKYGWVLYVYHDGPPNAGLDIVSANGPMPGDTRAWFQIEGLDETV